MRKGFLVGLLVVCFGGYSAYWYIHAQQIEKALKEEIASQQYATITYDAIEKRGFPFSIQLALVNPKVHVQNEAISFDLDGHFAGRWSVFGALKDIDMSGKSRFAMPMNEGGAISEVHFEGNTVAEIDSVKSLADKGVLKISQGRMHSSETEGFGEFDWRFDLITASYDIKHPSEDRALVDLDVELAGGVYNVNEPSEKSPDLMDFYRAIVGTVAEKSGKTNSSVVIKCDLPSKAKIEQLIESPLLLFTEAIPKVSVELKKIITANAFSDSDMIGLFTLSEDDKNNIVMHIDGSGFMHYLPGYHDALIASIDKLSKLAQNWEAPQEMASVKNLLSNNSDALKGLVPHPETLGKIEFGQSALVVVNKRNLDWHVAIDNLSLACDKYGIAAKVDAQEQNNSTHAEAVFALKNAPNLIEELVSFYNRVEGVVNLFEQDTNKHLKQLPEGSAAKIVAFLSRLSSTPNYSPNDMHITIAYNNGNVQIGPLTREEARAEAEILWAEIMGEALPQPPPSSHVQPVLPIK